MAVTSAPEKSVAPIVVPGQLTLRTIRGKNGPFTVGRLATHLGTFEVKDPELEQYPEGKYDGEFIIRYIFPKSYPVGGGMRFEIRASLDGMTLNGIDKLSRDEARSFATQDVDPLDEEQGAQPAATPAKPAKASRPAKPAPVQASADPLVDTTPFGVDAPPPAAAAAPGSTEDGDAALFGLLWPLGESVKLDSTIDRRTLRAQIARLGELGYALDFKTQEWSRQAEPQAACADAACAVFFIHPPGFLPHAGEALAIFWRSPSCPSSLAIPRVQRWMNPRGGNSARRPPHTPSAVAACPRTTT